MPDQLHTITWDADGVGTFHCAGDRTAACHMYPECECDFVTVAHTGPGHESVPHDDCWMITSFLDYSPEAATETFAGIRNLACEMPRVDGAVNLAWDGDTVLWEYADELLS